MGPKKNPLEDARKRLKEKLDSIEEHSAYIKQVLEDTVSNATGPAKALVQQKDRKKFFSKYSSISQDLEKCLDFLLVLSDSVSAVNEDEESEDTESNEEESSKDEHENKTEQKTEKPQAKVNQGKHEEDLPVEQRQEDENSKKSSLLEVAQKEELGKKEEPQVNKKNSQPVGKAIKTEEKVDLIQKEELVKRVQLKQNKERPPLEENPPNDERKQVIYSPPTDDKAPNQKLKGNEIDSQSASAFARYQASKDKIPPREPNSVLSLPSGRASQTNTRQSDSPIHDKMFDKPQSGVPNKETCKERPDAADVMKKSPERSDQIPNSPRSKNKAQKQKDSKSTKERASPVPKKKGKDYKQGKSKAEVRSTVEKLGRKSPIASSFQDRKIATAAPKGPAAKKAVQLKSYPFLTGACLEVIVTEVLSPWELWMQPISTDLDLLMEKMCMEFAKAAGGGYVGGLTVPPSVGDFCCARFIDDDTWYRARVTAIHHTDDSKTHPSISDSHGRRLSSSSTTSTSSQDGVPGIAVEVVCIDDGNREKLPLNRLRPLPEIFATLPCQALCCALSDIQPIRTSKTKQGNSIWDERAIAWLKNKVSGTKLQAYPSTTCNGALLTVQLYQSTPGTKGTSKDTGVPGTLPGLQFSISHQMINAGLAQLVQPIVQGTSSPMPSPASVSSEEEKVSSSATHPEVTTAQELNSKAAVNASGLGKVDNKFDFSSSAAASEDAPHTGDATNQFDFLSSSAASEVVPHTGDAGVTSDSRIDTFHERAGNCIGNISVSDQVAVDKEPSIRRSPDGSSVIEGEESQPACLRVMMAEVASPSEFFVHLITPEAGLLDVLMDEIQVFYNGSDSTVLADYRLGIGDYCCARFSDDQKWYRAQVHDVKVTPVEGGQGENDLKADIEVLYIDFGNMEWRPISETRPLLARFMMIPGFAVKCRLAGVQPAVSEDDVTTTEPGTKTTGSRNMENDSKENIPNVPESTIPSTAIKDQTPATKKEEEKDNKNSKVPGRAVPNPLIRPSRGRGRKKKLVIDENTVMRAAGDESYDSDMSESGLLIDLPDKEGTTGTSKSDGSVKDEKASALPEKYLVPSPDKESPRPVPEPEPESEAKEKRAWSPEATELFKGLTGDDKSLMGLMVPWNPHIYQQVFCSMAPVSSSPPVDITYRRPILALQLYDTTEDEDIHINQVLLDTGLAEPCEDEVDPTTGYYDNNHAEVAKKVKVTINELENIADRITRPGSPDSSGSESATEEEYRVWNPMMEDYRSSRNAYRTDIDDAEIAILGYKSRDLKVCKYFKSSTSTCWRGDNCPFLHLKQGEQPKFEVQAFCNNIASSVELPDVGTWVAVRVTAILNPGHFWVQFPYGSDPIEKKMIEARTSVAPQDSDDEEDEDLDAMMKRMNNFYSRNLFREGGPILPAMGELAVAKCGDVDEALWYRALVTDLKDEQIQVSLVDYGNSTWVHETCVKRMLPQFLHLPFQAVECLLANVEPADKDSVTGWSSKAGEVFEVMTADKILIAQVLSSSPSNNTLYLDLFNTENNEEVYINDEMVRLGFARRAKTVLQEPRKERETQSEDEEIIIMVPG